MRTTSTSRQMQQAGPGEQSWGQDVGGKAFWVWLDTFQSEVGLQKFDLVSCVLVSLELGAL